MRISSVSLAALGTAAAGFAGPALSADMPEEPFEPPVIERAAPEDIGFVALRGSLAYVNGHDWAFVDDVGGGPADPPVHTNYQPGWYAGAAVGYYLPVATDPVRFYGEVEFGYMQAETDTHLIGTRDYVRPWSSGTLKGFIGASLGAEIDTGTIIRPYVSGGVGFATVKFDRFSVYDVNSTGTNVDGWNVRTDGYSTAFAYQASVGALAALSPSLDLEFGYRFLGVENVSLDTVNPSTRRTYTMNNKVDLRSHQVMVGLRHRW
ncbi:MAG: hypothetical protein R3D02_05500 [Hyphomicrobiales bacterium]